MAGINPNDPRPPYAQIADDLREAMRLGRLTPGDQLDSVRNLADQYGVSHMTVNHAVRRLREEGLLVSWQGRGVFVRDPTADPRPEINASAAYNAIMQRLDAMHDDMQRMRDDVRTLRTRVTQLEEVVDDSVPQDDRPES